MFKPGDRVVLSPLGEETFSHKRTIRKAVVVRVRKDGLVVVRKGGKWPRGAYHPSFWQLDDSKEET